MTTLRPNEWRFIPAKQTDYETDEAVQNAPVIHVTRMKNSASPVFRARVKPSPGGLSHHESRQNNDVMNVGQKQHAAPCRYAP